MEGTHVYMRLKKQPYSNEDPNYRNWALKLHENFKITYVDGRRQFYAGKPESVCYKALRII